MWHKIDAVGVRRIQILSAFEPEPSQEDVGEIEDQRDHRQVGPERDRQDCGFSVCREDVLRGRLELAFCFIANGTQEVDIRFVKVIFVGIGICERPRSPGLFTGHAKDVRTFLLERELDFVGSGSHLMKRDIGYRLIRLHDAQLKFAVVAEFPVFLNRIGGDPGVISITNNA